MKRILSALALTLFAIASHAQAPSAFPYVKYIPNDPSTGTTQFTLTKINASGNAVIMATTDVNGYAGVCISNCGTSGTAWVAFAGVVPVKVDASTTVQHYITISGTTGGDGHDTGVTAYPASGGVIGRVATASSGSGSFSMVDLGPEIQGSLGAFPQVLDIPAANCNNATGGAGWSIGASGSVVCRNGTNNKGGYIPITDTSSSFAQFKIHIPKDWNTTTLPFIEFDIASNDTTNTHTIIPQIQVSCPTATNGTTTDDATFAATHNLTTITIGSSAVNNGFYTTSGQMNSTDTAGCVAGGMMIVQVGRAADSATSANFYGASITLLRTPVMQAN